MRADSLGAFVRALRERPGAVPVSRLMYGHTREEMVGGGGGLRTCDWDASVVHAGSGLDVAGDGYVICGK